MKILVTGANGFVGKYVVRALLAANHEVVACSLEPESVEPRHARLRYVSADLSQPRGDWFEEFGKPDAVIHLAWGGLPNYGEMFHIEENLWSSYFFVKRLVESGLKDVTVIGTCAEYGLREGRLSEDDHPAPNTAYSVAKNSLRMFLEEYRKKTDFHFKWIRLFYMFGEGQNKRSLLELLKAAIERGETQFDMSGGEQLRDYLPVEQVAANIVRIATQNRVTGIVNCGSGTPTSVRKLVEEDLKKREKQIKLNFGFYPYNSNEPMAAWADIRKLESI